LCLANIDAVWEAVNKGVEEVVDDVCGDLKLELASQMKWVSFVSDLSWNSWRDWLTCRRSILREKQHSFRQQTIQLTDSLCDSESEDPWLIDFREGKVGVSIDHATKHFSDEYDKLYNPAPPELGRPCASDPIDPPMSGKEAKLVFEVMANVTVYLICGATRLGNVVEKVSNWMDSSSNVWNGSRGYMSLIPRWCGTEPIASRRNNNSRLLSECERESECDRVTTVLMWRAEGCWGKLDHDWAAETWRAMVRRHRGMITPTP
jgi:hypothetical protein